jgi:branched-chain amino acid transport system substrate-binding protein
LLHWRVLRFASIFAAFAVLLVLAACGGRMVPAPVISPQPPFAGPALPAEPARPPDAEPLKVALLVPLSGPNAELGKAMLEAAQLALFATDSERLTLIPRDTSGTGDGAAGAARSALAEGARLILGPLLAAEVAAVKPIAAGARINVIAFTTQSQLAGGNVFLMGFLPRQEVVRTVSFARERGLRRFAALVPDSPYGRLMAEALREATAASGGTVAGIEYTDGREPDASAAIARLLPGGTPGQQSPAAAGFEALLLPEGGARLRQIARQVQDAGIAMADVRLLGSGLWDDPATVGEPALYGGWFAASPPNARREFESRFQATYGRLPPRLSSLAFDAAALAAVLAQHGGADPFTQEAILQPSGFIGVDGLFRFTRQGLVQRGLAVIEVGPQGNVVVSPAPSSFQDLAY